MDSADTLQPEASDAHHRPYLLQERTGNSEAKPFTGHDQSRDPGQQADVVDESFELKPLDEPADWMRLLQFVRKDADDPIEVTVSSWERSIVPVFNAISYAWGDEKDRRRITVDGKMMMVGWNCHHALWQARAYEPEAYVWIDSICINQTDLHEKGLQVRMMSSLYARAARVLACIGPSAGGSDMLIDLGGHLEHLSALDPLKSLPDGAWRTINTNFHEFGCGPSNSRVWWVLSHDADHILHLCQSFKHFAERPYWKRVWVVQEIAAAQEVVLLCGDRLMTWEALVRIRDTLGGMSDVSPRLRKVDTSAIRNIHMAATGQITTLQSFICNFRDSMCADPRDRLFAFSGLINWGSHGPFPTDYTKSKFQLCVDLAERRLLLIDIMIAFEVYTSDPAMRAAVSQRQKVTFADGSGHVTNPSRSMNWRTNRMGVLDSNDLGQLTMNIRRQNTSSTQADDVASLATYMQDIRRRPSVYPIDWAGRPPQGIMDDGNNVIGWACNDARPGDVLLPCNDAVVVFNSTTPYLLVLRQSGNDVFDIVGQALLLGDYELPWNGRGYVAPGRRRPKVDGYSRVAVFLTAEDEVVLVGQDLAPGRTHDPLARVGRLFTAVTAKGSRAVHIEFHEYTDIEAMTVGSAFPSRVAVEVSEGFE